jgi:hypothetical protein
MEVGLHRLSRMSERDIGARTRQVLSVSERQVSVIAIRQWHVQLSLYYPFQIRVGVVRL